MIKKLNKFFLHPENIAILIILAIAAFMRLYRIDSYLTFLGDEGRDVLVVRHILQGDFTFLGPTASVGGFFLGPIYYYFMAPFLFLFNYNPIGPAVMVALVGVLTVWLLYKVSNDFFGVLPSLVISLLYALSPLVIVYSRSSWNPNVVPFFALLAMYVMYKAGEKKSTKLFILLGILLGILLQLHYLATFLGLVVGLYVLYVTFFVVGVKILKRIQTCLWLYISIFIGLIIGWSPFLVFEVRHGFPNIRSIFEYVLFSQETGAGPGFIRTIFDVAFRLFSILLLAFPESSQLSKYPNNAVQLWSIISFFIILICLSGLIYSLILHSQKKDKFLSRYVLLAIWLVVGIGLFGLYKKQIYDYYFGILFPLPFLLLGNVYYLLWRNGKIIRIALILTLLGLVALMYVERPIKTPGNFQLDQVRGIANSVLSKTEGKPYNFAVISAGGNSDYAYRYFFEIAGRTPITIQFPGVDPARKSITDQLLIVCESVPCAPRGYPLWEVAGFGPADIAGEWPVSVVRVYRLVHYKGK